MAKNITEFSFRCQPDLPACPLGLINQHVVDAIIAFSKDTYIFDYGFEISILSTDPDTSDNNAVTLDLSAISGDPYVNKRPVSFVMFKIDGAKFPTEHGELSTDITNLENIRYGSTRYFSFPSSTTVKIWPMEAQAAKLYLQLVFKPVVGITTIDDLIFDDHHEAIEAWAKWSLMRQSGKKWSNIKEAMINWSEYLDKMGTARAEITQKRTKDSITLRPKYSFC